MPWSPSPVIVSIRELSNALCARRAPSIGVAGSCSDSTISTGGTPRPSSTGSGAGGFFQNRHGWMNQPAPSRGSCWSISFCDCLMALLVLPVHGPSLHGMVQKLASYESPSVGTISGCAPEVSVLLSATLTFCAADDLAWAE